MKTATAAAAGQKRIDISGGSTAIEGHGDPFNGAIDCRLQFGSCTGSVDDENKPNYVVELH